MHLPQRRRRIGDVLEHLGEQRGVGRLVVDGQVVGGGDDGRQPSAGVDGLLPIDRPVVAVVEELAVGRVAGADVVHHRAAA